MEGISLDSQALEQLHGEQKALLDAIDDLRKHGIGRFVDLPQIIVVGDQSSGKSSVLEAISRVRFPVKDGLCTRFATELVLRTDNQTRVDVRIQPSATSNKEAHSFDEKSFDKDELPRIIDDAKKKMLKDDTGFSEDVLRVEISSPDVPHLTMVDLPGFYHSEDENQSAAGRVIVDRLVERYMARKNSIILAIVSARNQVILQKVLSKVKHHDKEKGRTLGIITKPDILASASQDEANFVRLAKNLDRSHGLSLGWHVLRNRGETEASDTDEERDKKERKFFESSLWSSVPSKNRGVEALRKKLSGILLSHIKNNLQGLIQSIEENITDRKTQLDRLGELRSTPKEFRTYLDRIASQFHILCLHAVEGNYADKFFGGLYSGDEAAVLGDSRIRKLRALVRDFNRIFAYVLETKGTRRIILPKESPEGGDSSTDSEWGEFEEKSELPTFLRPLESLYKFKKPEEVTFEDIAADLESLSSANQGSEFPGTSNDRLAVKLFQDQSQPWEGIARRHLEVVLHMTKAFVEKLLDDIVNPDKRTSSAILSEIVDPFFEQKSILLESKLQELLYHYKSGHPQPLDAEFRALLASRHQKNIGIDAIRDLMATRPELFTETARAELEKVTPSKHESEFGVDRLIDKSETYYEMSLRTFTDNVIVLAIENCLIRDLPSIFTTGIVNKMECHELERLASESPEIQVERDELQAEYDALKKGLQVCNKFKERKTTSVPSIWVKPDNPPTTRSSGDEFRRSPTPSAGASNKASTPREMPRKMPKQGGLFNSSDQKPQSQAFTSIFQKANTPFMPSSNSSKPLLFSFDNPIDSDRGSPFAHLAANTTPSSSKSIFDNISKPAGQSPFSFSSTSSPQLFGLGGQKTSSAPPRKPNECKSRRVTSVL